MSMIEVRYFAAARAAAGGTAREAIALPPRTEALTREQLAALLVSLHPDAPEGEPSLTQVLEQSSVLVDGVVLRDDDAPAVRAGTRVDVLPPFAGG